MPAAQIEQIDAPEPEKVLLPHVKQLFIAAVRPEEYLPTAQSTQDVVEPVL